MPLPQRHSSGYPYNMTKARKIVGVSRRGGGVSGKECLACRQWKPLAEYTMERKRGGNIKVPQTYCTQCMNAAKAEEKKKLWAQRKPA